MAGPLLTDGINLGALPLPPVKATGADQRAEEEPGRGRGPNEAGSAVEAESVPLAERLADMTIPEIEEAVEEGEFSAQEAADTEATFDEPRVGVLSLGTN